MKSEEKRLKIWKIGIKHVYLLHQNVCDMSRKECTDVLNACKETLQEKYGILSLCLFGSTARDEQNINSDVDVFMETQTPNPFLLMEAKDYLELSTGRSVDIIRNHRNLTFRLRKRIERDGITIF